MVATSRFLLVLGEREAIRWVVTTGQMAFPAKPRREVSALREGDSLFMISTRGAFHNPTRDRTRYIGTAEVASAVRRFEIPLDLAGRKFESGCAIQITALMPYRQGVELAPLVNQLDSLRGTSHWGMLLRRPLVPISEADASVLRQAAGRWGGDLESAVASYRDIVPVDHRS